MTFDRDQIRRRDFTRVLRGYDPFEVDAHLREVGKTVAVMLDDIVAGGNGLPAAVKERIEGRVHYASLEAARVEADARSEADRILAEARAAAAEAPRQADIEAEEILGRATTSGTRTSLTNDARHAQRPYSAPQAGQRNRNEASGRWRARVSGGLLTRFETQ